MKFDTAFTLIELLVVMSIMATLSGMVIFAYDRSETDIVLADAYELQTVMQRARTLAMSTGKTHGVVFHIENAGDGCVLRNRSEKDDPDAPGRHWYCIIGPDNADISLNQYLGRQSTQPPIAQSNGEWKYNFFTLEDYVEAVKSSQAGQRHYLSKGVRFLALSDEDKLHKFDKHDTYPRPWFGHFDDATGTLYPWGAYNRSIDASLNAPNTGLDYQGSDGQIAYDSQLDTNINPNEVWGRIHYDEITRSGAIKKWPGQNGNATSVHTHFGFKANYVGPDSSVMPGSVRPLVNGYWCDFMIVFNPRGEALYADAKTRKCYIYRSWEYADGRGDVGSRNYDNSTGGYYITLCKDVDPFDETYAAVSGVTGGPAFNKFKNVEEAFASITPFARVFVNKITGRAEVHTNAHPYLSIEPDDLLQHEPYPRGFTE